MSKTNERTPRLADIEPKKLGVEVVEFVQAHLRRYEQWLSPGIALRFEGNPAESYLAIIVSDLTRYAQSGDVGDWGVEPLAVYDTIQDVSSALYSMVVKRGALFPDLRDEADPNTPIGVVLISANARYGIGIGRSVNPIELAILAGVAREHVYRLIRDGEIAARGDPRAMEISAAEARRWLGARGIAIVKVKKAASKAAG